MRPFRFGLQTSKAPSMAAWRDRARQAEDLGYSCLYIPDHFGDQYGPLVGLTVAAEATSSLRVGMLVLDNDFRHPVALAKEVATLDLAAEGRVEFGLGAGWMRSDYDQSGIAYDDPGVRVDRMEEALSILKALWAGGPVTFAGAHYNLTEASCEPGPYTHPHPPILVGGGGRRVLSIAAREADIVGVNLNMKAGHVGREAVATAMPEYYDRRIAWVRDAAGARFEGIELQVLTFVVMIVPNRQKAAEQVGPMFGVPPDKALDIPIALVGTIDEICETLVARRDRWGFNYVVIHEAELDSFSPVVERLAGT
jgi:probable F420-dependent oxidoreductase